MNKSTSTPRNTINYQKLNFDKKVLSVVSHLKPYVQHRIDLAEHKGIIPRNMYCSGGIIDDAIIQLYTTPAFALDTNLLTIELNLFRIVDQLIDELCTSEHWHTSCISTNDCLHQELRKLEEKFAYTVDNSVVMNEELNDISYHQQTAKNNSYSINDSENTLLNIAASRTTTKDASQQIDHFNHWLPEETTKIIHLFIFGKLNYKEIAYIKDMSPEAVKEIILSVRKKFRKHLT